MISNHVPDHDLEPPEHDPLFYCDNCDGEIYEGQEYHEVSTPRGTFRLCGDCVCTKEAEDDGYNSWLEEIWEDV